LNRSVLRVFLYLLPFPVLAASVLVGPSDVVGPAKLVSWGLSKLNISLDSVPVNEPLLRAILWDVRLPRILTTFLVGGSLGVAGNGLQALFRNPLVDPYLLGLSSGGAFGAALALTTAWLPVQVSAFGFGLVAVGLSFVLARTRKQVSTVSLILAGVVVSGVFTSLLTILQFLTDPFKLQAIVHWTMGNLHNATWDHLRSAGPLMAAGSLALFGMRWRMNVLALGDEHARAVGLHPGREKILVLVPATLAASASVAVGGVIGLVGLVVPHMVRMMIGPDNTHTTPASFAFGGAFLLIVDDISRSMAAFEMPVGVFTTLVGGPFFIYLLKRTRAGWEV
jgi:iron complex transport system permease protein